MSTLFPITRRSNIGFDRDMDSILSAFFGPTSNKTARMSSVMTSPRANVLKTDEGYSVELAAPGFSRDEFEIFAVDGVLTIQVGTSDTKEYIDNLTSREYAITSFTRSWSLPKEVTGEGITARYDAGILYVSIPTAGMTNEKIMINVD